MEGGQEVIPYHQISLGVRKCREFDYFASSKAESYFEDEDLREWTVAGDDLLLTTTVAPLGPSAPVA